MEGVPRIPMICFLSRRSGDVPNFRTKLKNYISTHYEENPDNYIKEISELESLRANAVTAPRDNTGIAILKKYYCQLTYLKSRFPIQEKSRCSINFNWLNAYSDSAHNWANVDFELTCILYNIGAFHSYLGAIKVRDTQEGLKEACTHFQCAAWAFQELNTLGFASRYFALDDVSPEILSMMHLTCMAQAQEALLEKSWMDNRKSTINVKVSLQIADFYGKVSRESEQIHLSKCSEKLVKFIKKWKIVAELKLHYYTSISFLFLGEQAEEDKKFGLRLGYYNAAKDKLGAAMKTAKSLDKTEVVHETLNFTYDVVNGKYEIAKKENEFIYHEKVPEVSLARSEVKGVCLVKGIPFRTDDTSISGPDIFAKLVPIEAHASSSLYSEEKAKILRKYSELIDQKNDELDKFLIALQLDQLDLHEANRKIPQELIDATATLNVDQGAVSKLNGLMNKLSGMYHDVESNLKEIEEFLEAQEGKKSNNSFEEIRLNAAKYRQAQKVASETNETLHGAMRSHISNLQILMKPLDEVLDVIPKEAEMDENAKASAATMRRLRTKIEEMQSQRSALESQLRESVINDDITKALVVKSTDQEISDFFEQELQKHSKITSILDQNFLAQANIMRALSEANAEYSEVRRGNIELMQRRSNKINSLLNSYRTYDELIEKCSKGIEFYEKLSVNVEKLLGKLKSVWRAQEEERERESKPKNAPIPPISGIPSSSNQPKLKDYLDMMKGGGGVSSTTPGGYYNAPMGLPSSGGYPYSPQNPSNGGAVSYTGPSAPLEQSSNQYPYSTPSSTNPYMNQPMSYPSPSPSTAPPTTSYYGPNSQQPYPNQSQAQQAHPQAGQSYYNTIPSQPGPYFLSSVTPSSSNPNVYTSPTVPSNQTSTTTPYFPSTTGYGASPYASSTNIPTQPAPQNPNAYYQQQQQPSQPQQSYGQYGYPQQPPQQQQQPMNYYGGQQQPLNPIDDGPLNFPITGAGRNKPSLL